MKPTTLSLQIRSARAAALLAVLGYCSISPPQALAQFGSLVVSITSPDPGSTVSATTTVSAAVTAVGGLVTAGVQFMVDGVNIGAEDTTAPYSVPWNTLSASNGSHTLTAVARSTLGAQFTSEPVTVTVFNDITPPTVTMTLPASGTTVAGAIAVSASASDNVSVVGVQFTLDGVNLGAEDTTPPYSTPWDTRTAGNGPHILAAIARDPTGNRGTAAVSVVALNPVTRFENTDLSIAYTPGAVAPSAWWHGSRSRAWSARTASFNRSEGARATFTFTGRSVSWIGFRAPWAGIARVFVDGVFAAEIDLYQTTEEVEATIFQATNLAPASHTLAVEVTGRRNDLATDNAVVVDAFDVAPALALPIEGGRFEQTASAVTYSSVTDWTLGDATRTWSAGTAAVSSTPGARATIGFTGTSISWIGLRGPRNGIARIFLDQAFHAQIDTFAPAEIHEVVFSATGLAVGSHTLTVEVTGGRNPAATGASIVVDAFDLRSRFEETEPSILFSGAWNKENGSFAWSGTSANAGAGLAATTSGGQASFSFTGTSVSWIGFRCPQCGVGRVFVDDVFVRDVDTLAPADEVQVPVFTAGGLADGPHTLRIEATGGLIVVDAFDVTLSSTALPITRVQETDSSVAYGANWSQAAGFPYWSGDSVAYSTAAGAEATFTFTGTSVRVIGQRNFDTGIARVYLDDVFVAQIDTSVSLQEEFQTALFSAAGLAAGTHTLRIEVTALRNPMIIIDAFEISR